MLGKIFLALCAMFVTFLINLIAVHEFDRDHFVQTFALFGVAIIFAMVSIGCIAAVVLEVMA